MLRLLLAVLLLVPCPGCWMQRLASATTEAPATAIAADCDCCHHDGGDKSLPSPLSPKPDCACKHPAIAAFQNDQSTVQAHPAVVPTTLVIDQTLLPTGVMVGGYTSVGFSTGPTRSSPLRR
jgi:hypothetical protein